MPIKPLPATSVRALGSGQALTDSLALVKELIENSLDASATQITIEISPNVLDVIQVKDNGHGIPEEDRDAIALRYYTSKIREFGDIQDCQSLGFRGEALASAAELAGGLVITTRAEGEKTASACTIDRGGTVVGRKAVSAPVGTTVRVEGFFKYLPVRRENALKGAAKSLPRLRTLVQKYYLSHPRCRFSLRILPSPQRGGAKGRSDDTVYAPSKTVQEAVQKAVGKDVAAACEWIDTSSSVYAEALANDGAESDEEPVVLEAFLPKPSTDPVTISKKPQCTNFTFVDSRPVSCSRGTLKQIHALYKSYLKSAISAPGISDPFIYLNIRCPPGSYDPNIEPAKDDVMFQDADTVIKTIENMLKCFYGELKREEKPDTGKEKKTLNGIELLLARKPKSPVPADAPKAASTLRNARLPEISGCGDVDEEEEELAAREMDVIMRTDGFVAMNSPQRKNTLPLPPMPDLGGTQLVGGAEEAEKAAGLPGGVVPTEDIDAASGSAIVTMATPRRKPTRGFNMSDSIEGGDGGSDDEPLEQHASDNEDSARNDITISNPWTAAKMNVPIHSSPVGSSPLPQRQMGKPFKPPSTIQQNNSSPSSPENTRVTRNGRTSALMAPNPSSPPTSSSMFREKRGAGVSRVRQINVGAGGNAGIMGSWISKAQGSVGDDDGGNESPTSARRGFVSAAEVYKDHINDEDDDEELYQQPVNQRTKRTKPAPTEALKRRRLNDRHQDKGFTPINREAHDDDDDLEPAAGPSKSSPHKNRFLAATAALNPPVSCSKESLRGTLTLEDDLSLLPPAEKTKPKRRRTKVLLPLDIVPDVPLQTHMLRKPVGIVTKGMLRDMFRGLRECDAYVGGSAAGMGRGEDDDERGGEEDEGMFFCESRSWDDAGVVGTILKEWMLGIAEKDGRKGFVDSVVGMGWEWGSGGKGDGEERVLCAVGVEVE